MEGIKQAHDLIDERGKSSHRSPAGRQLAVMLSFLGRGHSKLNFYRMLAEAALMSLGPASIHHADEMLRDAVCLLMKKNHDYGASVFDRGPLTPNLPPETAALVRLGDKYNRLLTLQDVEAKVSESIRDTIFDVLGYAIILMGMAVDAETKRSRMY